MQRLGLVALSVVMVGCAGPESQDARWRDGDESVPVDLLMFTVLDGRPELDAEFEILTGEGIRVETDDQVFDAVLQAGFEAVLVKVPHGGIASNVFETAYVPVNVDEDGASFFPPKLEDVRGERHRGTGVVVDDMWFSGEALIERWADRRDHNAVEPRTATVLPAGLWPGADVCYEYDPNVSDGDRERIEDVIASIELNTPLRFHSGRSQCGGDHGIIFDADFDDGACGQSAVGRIWVPQRVWLRCMSERTITHEILHAVGVFHEQSRPDRDAYVLHLPGHVELDREGNFDKITEGYTAGPYNWTSVMHYRGNAFSDGGPTLLRCPLDTPLHPCADEEGTLLALTTDNLGGDRANALDWQGVRDVYCAGTAPASRCSGSWPAAPSDLIRTSPLRHLAVARYRLPNEVDRQPLPVHLGSHADGTSFNLAASHAIFTVDYDYPVASSVFPLGVAASAPVHDESTGTYEMRPWEEIKNICVGIKVDAASTSIVTEGPPCFPHDPNATSAPASAADDLRRPGYQYHWLSQYYPTDIRIDSYTPTELGYHQLLLELDVWGYGLREGTVDPFAPQAYVWGKQEPARHVAATGENGAFISHHPEIVWMSQDEADAPFEPFTLDENETFPDLESDWEGGVVELGPCTAAQMATASNRRRFTLRGRGTGPVEVVGAQITGRSAASFRVLCLGAVPEAGFPFTLDPGAPALGVVEFTAPVFEAGFGDTPWFGDGYPEAPWGFFGNVEEARLEVTTDLGQRLVIPLQGYVW